MKFIGWDLSLLLYTLEMNVSEKKAPAENVKLNFQTEFTTIWWKKHGQNKNVCVCFFFHFQP